MRHRLIRRLITASALVLMTALALEGLLRLLWGPVELRQHYLWAVNTHLVDLSFAEFRGREARIRAARARQGMERGRSHPVYGWTYNPTFRLDDPEVEIHINAHGLRGEEFPLAKPAGEVRILCLGGSTTAGEEVREAETYPAQLEALLRRRCPGRAIRVINAGVPTYDLGRSLTQYALDLYRLEPDFVTIYHGINDLFDHTAGGPEIRPAANYTGRAVAPFVFEGDGDEELSLRDCLRPLVRRSQVLGLLRLAWSSRGPRRPALAAPDPDGVATFAAYYRALVREIAATGAVAVPMTFALAYPGDFDAADRRKVEASFAIWLRRSGIPLAVGREIIDDQNRAAAELARAAGLPLCDAAGAVPPDRRHFRDVCHLTAAGNQAIAGALAETLVPLLTGGEQPADLQSDLARNR